jgi:hypothetical protein
VKFNKALKLALHCMEQERKRHHALGLSGLSPGAINREKELLEAIECLTKCARNSSSEVDGGDAPAQIFVLRGRA